MILKSIFSYILPVNFGAICVLFIRNNLVNFDGIILSKRVAAYRELSKCSRCIKGN